MRFPRSHLILLATLSLLLTTFVVAKFNDDPQEARFSSDAVLAELSESEVTPQPNLLPVDPEITTMPEPAAPIVPPAPVWHEEQSTVKPGDNLALIFKRHNLTARDVYDVSQAKPFGSRLRNIYPGHNLTLFFDDEHRLMQMHYATGPLDTLVYEREGPVFTSRQITAEPEMLVAYKHGIIDHSLFVASQRAGLTDNLTMRLAQIFQWDIDFVLDIRPGDTFYVLFEELYLHDEFVGHGDILAAEFVNQGEQYRAIRYTTDAGEADYFAPDGASMRKAFLRAPVEFSRISSNFNLRRVHPLWKTVRPHRGIDYAAPTGTPILAAGDGRVTKATRTKANGNYVVLAHGEQFVTKYLHLSKFARGVRSGSKVKQGQTIGYVGATGWATAPHLHYEFLVNGVHKNPRTVSLPDARPIDRNEMPRFKEHTANYTSMLDSYKNQISVALAQ